MYAEKIITINTLSGYAPYTFKYEKKDVIKKGLSYKKEIVPGKDTSALQGMAWDIVRESFQSMGYTIKLNVLPWARALKKMKKGSVDALFPTTKTKERMNYFYYSKNATNSSGTSYYTKKNNEIQWKGLHSTKNKEVAVILGYSYGTKFDEFKKNLNLIMTKSERQSFILTYLGRVDGYIAFDSVADYFLKKTKQENKFKKYPPFDFNYEFLVTNLNDEKKKKKIDDFDKGIFKIKMNGRFQKILKKWNVPNIQLNPK